jgi:hypothetical protein
VGWGIAGDHSGCSSLGGSSLAGLSLGAPSLDGPSLGCSAFFLRRLRFSRASAAAFSSAARTSLFSLSSAANTPAASPILAARLEMLPSFVAGRYAPPANFTPHLRQCQTPTVSRFTARTWHWGHSWGARMPDTTSAYLRLGAVPYLGPKVPAGPTFLTFIFQLSLL